MPQYYYNPFQNNSGNDTAVNEQMRRMYERQQRENTEKRELRKISSALGIAIIAYLVIQTAASVLILGRSDLSKLYSSNAVFQYAFNVIFVSVLSVAVPFGIVALFNKKKYRHPIVPNMPIKASKTFAWVCFGMGSCILANIIVNYAVTLLKTVFKINLTQGESLSPDSVFACIMEIIALAVIPAVCEEFAMRCCSLQLLRKYGIGFSVFAVSIVFGLLHGNVIQFMFAFIIGLVLAYVTVKTDSIVPAIFIHMLNNGMSAVQDIVKYALGEKISDNTLVAMFIFWVAAGIIAAVYLLIKKEFRRASKDNGSVLTFGQKLGSFLFPGMVVPFLILIIITCTTVSIG